ncbi:hypothetical protein C0993_007690 [Termitomyces sp. T159_Od127]|nr:hypothetical protein C0993_007690 [Termitomyces sp. T159_Od127]
MSQQPVRRGLSFLTSGLMAALKFKRQNEQYNLLLTDEGGRPALSSKALDPTASLLDREGNEACLSGPEILEQERSGCCESCGPKSVSHPVHSEIASLQGLSGSIFWNILRVVAAGVIIWYSVKLIVWAVSDMPSSLEHMPAFSSSLGCLTAPHVYNDTKVVMTAQVGPENDHSFDFRGSAVGTLLLAQGASDLRDVKYEMTLRASDEMLLKNINIVYPDFNEDGSISRSRLMISAPSAGIKTDCMRFDIVMYIPSTLQKLNVVSHSTTHVQFAPDADIKLEYFYVTLFAMDENNLILPSQTIRSDYMSLELIRGWIVGDVAILNDTSITTQRGDGITNVRAHPTAPSDHEYPIPATFSTTTGAGRTDIFYIGSKAFKRRIDSTHLSSRNAEMYLTYKKADFSGRAMLDSKSYTATGLHRLENISGDQTWTHWAGNQYGTDEIFVRSRGWSGLYL